MTVPPVLPDIVQTRLTEIVFEDLEFDAYSQVSSPSMILEASKLGDNFS
jgi:hypothetical protein